MSSSSRFGVILNNKNEDDDFKTHKKSSDNLATVAEQVEYLARKNSKECFVDDKVEFQLSDSSDSSDSSNSSVKMSKQKELPIINFFQNKMRRSNQTKLEAGFNIYFSLSKSVKVFLRISSIYLC
jgi:hypothetical protein